MKYTITSTDSEGNSSTGNFQIEEGFRHVTFFKDHHVIGNWIQEERPKHDILNSIIFFLFGMCFAAFIILLVVH